ncbi:MAG: hypothetical protein ACLPVW_08100 [Terriglobales bacterium]
MIADFTCTRSFFLPEDASISVDPGTCVFQLVMLQPSFFNAVTTAASPACPICADVAISLLSWCLPFTPIGPVVSQATGLLGESASVARGKCLLFQNPDNPFFHFGGLLSLGVTFS